IETLALAKKLGVEDSTALANLNTAVVVASRLYAESISNGSAKVFVDGNRFDAEDLVQPKLLESAKSGRDRPVSLLGPEESLSSPAGDET
ncbi:hypothetical protein, partial [Luteimonas changyuni]|uniref:hypothetical protein n=1 Tax=Luteimonas sp. MJ145 TaxID=3129234 RepID=UPI0031BAFDFD